MTRLLSRPIIRNLTWTIPGGIVEAIVKAAAVILLARILGPAEFGLVVLVLSIVAILSLLSDAGLSAATARRLSEAPGSVRSTLRAGTPIIVGLLVVTVAALVAATGWLASMLGAPSLDDLRWLISLLVVVAVGRKFTVKFFEGLGRADMAGKVSIAMGWTPWLLALAAVLLIAARAAWALAGYAAASVLVLGVLVMVLARLIRQDPDGGKEDTSRWQLVRYAVPMAATAAGFLVYTQVDLILVQYYLTTDQVGIYGTAVRLMDLLHVPAAAVGASVAVYFVRLTRDQPGQTERLFELVSRGLLFLYLPAATVLLLYGTDIVTLVFGAAYAAAGPVVAIYVPFLLLKALAGTYSLALDYLGFATRRAVLVSISAIANIALNVWLIPRHGIIGAAVATQLSYGPLGLYYMWLLARESGAPLVSAKTGRLGLATAVTGAAAFALVRVVDAHFVLAAVAFLVVYVLLVVSAQAVTKEEWRTLLSYLGRESRPPILSE